MGMSRIEAEHGLMHWRRNSKPEVVVDAFPTERDEEYWEKGGEHTPVGLTTPILGECHLLPPYIGRKLEKIYIILYYIILY